MTDDLKAPVADIKAKAKKATPGPWHWVNRDTDEPRKPGDDQASLRTVEEFPGTFRGLPKFIIDYAEISAYPYDKMDGNADFIAAADPTTVLRLIEALETAEKERDALRAENARLRAALEPFADMADAYDLGWWKDEFETTPRIGIPSVGDLRRAREATAQKRTETA